MAPDVQQAFCVSWTLGQKSSPGLHFWNWTGEVEYLEGSLEQESPNWTVNVRQSPRLCSSVGTYVSLEWLVELKRLLLWI